MAFDGMHVVALESRRALEMAELIRKQGGEPFVAPSMKEIPLDSNEEALAAAERLFAGEFEMMIFLTGVGARALHSLLATRHPEERFPEALRRLTVVARGPKPAAALRELNVPVALKAPEPNTWREVMGLVRGRPEKRIAVQEYGRANPRLVAALEEQGAQVTPIRIYQWALPDDTGPLREAARGIVEGRFDVTMFTTPNQLVHLFQIAEEEGVRDALPGALAETVVASIGPSTTEMLESYGIRADMEPSRPKMGFFVKEAAEQAAGIRRGKATS